MTNPETEERENKLALLIIAIGAVLWILLATERRDLMPWQDEDWPSLKGVEPMKDRIIPVTPTIAKDRFLLRYCQINNFFQTAFTEQRKVV